MKNNNRLTPQLILFIFAYIFIVGLMALIHIQDVTVHLEMGVFTVSDIDMMLTMILMLVVISNIAAFRQPAFRMTKVLFVVQLITILVGYYIKRDAIIVPALLTVVFMSLISFLIYKHLNTIERNERELHKIAYTDSLTNTPNRRAFNNFLEELAKKGEPFAMVYIDFNKFTLINETAGHEYGDMVLNEAVTRWKHIMNENDFIARLSGDEFALVVTDYKNSDSLVDHVKKFSTVLDTKVTIDDQSVFISASFGISLFPQHTKDLDELVRYADIAMQLSRITGDSNVIMYEESMIKNVERSANIEKRMRTALANDEFNLVFQPQYDTVNKKLRGFETLLRLKDDDGTPISPAVFIPIAEKNGMIVDIDNYVLKKAMRTFKPMLEKYNQKLMLSVNISAIHISKNGFMGDVEAALAETHFPPQNLELEITESVLISSFESTVDMLNKLKSKGIQLALDDFGTGYASLNYLTKLPIDLLKIDKTFVDGLRDENNLTDFVAAIISMGHLMHFDVISEGVEYETQLNTLKVLKCDFIQGYIWGRPMDIESVDALLNAS